MREQVCLYMCPWPRIQAALTDEHALNVTYRYDRGEPRGSVKKSAALARAGQAGRRLHRLLSVRLCLPDRRRHPQRAQSRLHPVRAVHRRLRRRDGEDRPAAAADRLRYRPQHQAPAGRRAPVYRDRPRAHRALRRDHRAGRRASCSMRWRRGSTEAISVIHDRNPMFVRLPTARCATATRCASSTRRSSRASFVLDRRRA